jgi:hypothetical protein
MDICFQKCKQMLLIPYTRGRVCEGEENNLNKGPHWIWENNLKLGTGQSKYDRLCGLVIRVPGYRAEMYCDSCEVRTELRGRPT